MSGLGYASKWPVTRGPFEVDLHLLSQESLITCKGIHALITSEEHTVACASKGIVDRALVIVSSNQTNDIFGYHVLVNSSWRRAPGNAKNSPLDFQALVISRSASGEHVLFIGNDRRSCSSLVNIKSGQRHTLSDHQVRRRSPAVCHLGDRTILAGGFPDDTTTFASVEILIFPGTCGHVYRI